MSANFTPDTAGYADLTPFRFWCQKVLPAVYDDSLSYYEMLCKVRDVLNNVIQNVEATETNINALLTAYNQLQDYVNNYFDSLDVQNEINTKLDNMASSGELGRLLEPYLPEIITDWLDEHITPTSPIVDNSLTISGAAADAKIVGDKFTNDEYDIHNLENGFSTIEYHDTIASWEQGGLRSSNGGNSSASNRIRCDYIKVNNTVAVDVDDEYKYLIFIYSNTNISNYIGVYNNGNISTDATWLTKKSFINVNKNYYFRIVVAKSDDSDLTPENVTYVHKYYGTDRTYTNIGVPADANKVGGDILSLNTRMNDRVPFSYAPATVLSAGTDLDTLGVGAYVSQTTEITMSLIHAPVSESPFRLECYETTGTNRYVQIAFANHTIEWTDNTAFYIRRKPTIASEYGQWNKIPNTEYVNDAVASSFVGTSIRVFQNNIGKFRWGHVQEGDLETYGLTEEQYQEKLANYRKLFSQLKPDIMGFQEWAYYMDKAQTHNSADNLLVPITRFHRPNSEAANVYIAGNIKGSNYRFRTAIGHHDGTEYSLNWYLVDVDIGGKTILVATGALYPAYQDVRLEQIASVCSWFEGYDYGIILSDLNAGYKYEDGVLVDHTLGAILAIANQNGFTACNELNGYWGATKTYVMHAGQDEGIYYRCLDNILVKGRIKIKNFEVLTNEYNNLASDHIPCIADLYIY